MISVVIDFMQLLKKVSESGVRPVIAGQSTDIGSVTTTVCVNSQQTVLIVGCRATTLRGKTIHQLIQAILCTGTITAVSHQRDPSAYFPAAQRSQQNGSPGTCLACCGPA